MSAAPLHLQLLAVLLAGACYLRIALGDAWGTVRGESR